MNLISKLGLKPEEIDAIGPYVDVLQNMPSKDFELLTSFFIKIKQYEVASFAYRIIDKGGFSATFSTDCNWAKIKKDVDFAKAMLRHMNSEVFFVKQHNLKVVTRSKVKKQTTFLKILDRHRINNSIVYYSFNKDIIEIFYYIPSLSVPGSDDLILNNIEKLVSLTKEISSPLSIIRSSKEFQAQKTKMIEKEILNFVWKEGAVKHAEKKTKICLAGHEMSFTTKEVECLLLLKYGCSNKYMARELCISEFTVKDRINNLKRKVSAETREDLVKIIQSIPSQYVNKLMEIL